MNRFLDFLLSLAFLMVIVFLYNERGREIFVTFTLNHPIFFGFVKFSVLATMGEMLTKRLANKGWILTKARWRQRFLVWGCFGVLFTYVFPLYSSGVESLIDEGLLPVFGKDTSVLIMSAFWKSFWMNLIFAFPMMTLHRVTDSVIDRGKLFSRWPFMEVWNSIDWRNMWGFVAPSIVWFWLPAHTITFCLPSEFRIITAAGLSICLGAILTFAKIKTTRGGK